MIDRLHAGWGHYWHPICHRSEISAPRSFIRFDIYGEEIAVFNDGDGIVAFDNLCPHRGARIFDGVAGKAPFLCRYHGWSYSKGKLFVADKGAFAHCDIANASLSVLPHAWVGDFLFVSRRPSQSVHEQLGETASLLETISTDIDQCLDINRYDYECDWRIAVENALEPYHVGAIHPETLNSLKLSDGINEYHGQNSIWYSDVTNTTTAGRLRKISKMFDLKYQHEGYFSIFIFPFSMLSSTFSLSYSLQNFLPSAESERTHFTSRLYSSRLRPSIKPAILADFFSSSVAMNRRIFEEDAGICRRVPLRSWSEDPPRYHAATEGKLLHFRESYRSIVPD